MLAANEDSGDFGAEGELGTGSFGYSGKETFNSGSGASVVSLNIGRNFRRLTRLHPVAAWRSVEIKPAKQGKQDKEVVVQYGRKHCSHILASHQEALRPCLTE